MYKGKVTFLSEQYSVKLWALPGGNQARTTQGDSTGMVKKHMFTDNDQLIIFGALSMCKKASEYEGKPVAEDRLIHQLKILDVGAGREKTTTAFIKEYAPHAWA